LNARSYARKVAAMGEIFNVRTAWHGPGDVSPIGHACNLHLNLNTTNFGIQEYTPFNDATREIFSGCPEMKSGYLYASETGLGHRGERGSGGEAAL
jgi:mannonate dehydratase